MFGWCRWELKSAFSLIIIVSYGNNEKIRVRGCVHVNTVKHLFTTTPKIRAPAIKNDFFSERNFSFIIINGKEPGNTSNPLFRNYDHRFQYQMNFTC